MNPSSIDGNGRYQRQYAAGVHCLKCGSPLTPGKVVTTHSTGAEKGRICVLWSDGRTGCNWPENSESQDKARAAMGLSHGSARPETSRTLAGPASADPLTMAIVAAVEPVLAERLKATVDEDRVLELVQQALDQTGRHVYIHNPETQEKRDMGVQHYRFPVLVRAMTAKDHKGQRLNIWLAGPAGSGKTTAAEKAAEALGLAFAFSGAINEVYRLVGFMSPGSGQYVSTDFRKAYENGGVFLLDEVDASDPAVVLELNAALANSSYPFPDGMVKRHPDFVCLAAANTWGLGGTNDYVGRSKMDAAFLNRFVFISWDYDTELERSFSSRADWCERVLAIRSACRAKGLRVVISPRATIFGCALLDAGSSWEEAEELALRTCMTPDQWAAVSAASAN